MNNLKDLPVPRTPVTRAVIEADQCHSPGCSGDVVPNEIKNMKFLIQVLQEKIKMERNDNRLCLEKLEKQLQVTLNMKCDLEDTIQENKSALVDINDKYLKLENEFNCYTTERNKTDIEVADNISRLTDIIETNVGKLTTNFRNFISLYHNISIQELSNNENEINIIIFETVPCLKQTTESIKTYCKQIKDICLCFINNDVSNNKTERFKVIEALYKLNNFTNSKINNNNNHRQEISESNKSQEHETLNKLIKEREYICSWTQERNDECFIENREQEVRNNGSQHDCITVLKKRIKVLEETGLKLSTALRCTEMEKLSISLRVSELEDKNKKLEFMNYSKENEVINLKTKFENICATVENQRKTIDNLYHLLNNQQGRLEESCKLSLSLSQAEEKILQLEEEVYLQGKILKQMGANGKANNKDMTLNKYCEETCDKPVRKNPDSEKHIEQCKKTYTDLTKSEVISDDEKSDVLAEKLRKVSILEAQLKKCQEEKDELEKYKMEAQKELKALHFKVAAAHGHQNLKQKIRYVSALKQENLHLIEQNAKLNAEITTLKKKFSGCR